MRNVFFILALSSMVCCASYCAAQDGEWRDDAYQGARDSDDQYRDRLRQERYETAIARERAERAYLDHQARAYEYQRRAQEMSLRRAEQGRQYDGRSNDISTVNQAANSIANIARQAQIIGSGRGW